MADFSITQIPSIMDANSWRIAAALMRRWFAFEANDVPAKGHTCTDIVKMDWVLRFERAKSAYQEIFDKALWKTPNAQKEMAKVLKRRGLLRPRASSAYSRNDVRLPQTHDDHIQYVSVGGGMLEMATGELDHLRAALARFNFHVIAFGLIEANASTPNRFSFTVSELGVYVRDSYDFNDAPGEDQELGTWDPDDNSVGRTFLSGGTGVRNSDFRKWRTAHGKGGDYLIFSDVKYTKLPKPEPFTLEA